MPAPVTVIVEPDSFSAWIGVAGVGIGVVLSAGVQIVRDVMRGRKDRTRELTEAVDTMLGACNQLAILVAIRQQPGVRDEPALAWAEATNREAERIQTAAHVVQRYARHEVGEAAGQLAVTVFEVIGSENPVLQMPRVYGALDAFYHGGRGGALRKSFPSLWPRPAVAQHREQPIELHDHEPS